MYTRSYNDPSDTLRIPEGYDGTALINEATEVAAEPEAKEQLNHWQRQENEEDIPAAAKPKFFGKKFFGELPFGDFFSGIFKKGKFTLQNIGFEEILIGAAALYLLFAKDGDKECAIMLIILLFIN